MLDHSPSTDERASLAQPSQSSSPLECTSHLGFSLVTCLPVVNQGHWDRGIHKQWDTLNAIVVDLYQVKVVRSITPFASSRARCGDWRSR